MKMLVTDFDLTLFNENDYNDNIKLINEFISNGNIFVIATGRNISQLDRNFDFSDVSYSYLICNDGAIIFDKNNKVVYRCDISNECVKGIASILMNSDFIDDWYYDNGFNTTKEIGDKANGIIGHFIDRNEAKKILDLIENTYSEVHGYLSEEWINITEKSVNKGNGIKIVANMINLKGDKIYTIGDNCNDISMCNYDFNCYCMENAVNELKILCNKQYKAVYELVKDIIKEE